MEIRFQMRPICYYLTSDTSGATILTDESDLNASKLDISQASGTTVADTDTDTLLIHNNSNINDTYTISLNSLKLQLCIPRFARNNKCYQTDQIQSIPGSFMQGPFNMKTAYAIGADSHEYVNINPKYEGPYCKYVQNVSAHTFDSGEDDFYPDIMIICMSLCIWIVPRTNPHKRCSTSSLLH